MRVGLVFLAFVLLGAGYVWHLDRTFRECRRLSSESVAWPHVSGGITDSHLETYQTSRTITKCRPSIHFAYAVDGRSFHGERATYRVVDDCRSARALVDQYPPGSPVIVYYRPLDPSVSVLQPHSWAGDYIRSDAATWIALGVLGVVVMGMLIRHRRASAELSASGRADFRP
jgi:hypothetical protein